MTQTVVVAAKSSSDASTSNGSATFPPDPNSPQSTITTVVREICDAGGDASAIAVDVRDQNSVEALVRKTIEVGGEHGRETPSPSGPHSPASLFLSFERSTKQMAANTHFSLHQKYQHLDALIYNPGAIWWASVEDTPPRRFRLMQAVNVEGLYLAIHAALPHLKRQSATPHGGRIIVVSPPIYSRFFRGKTAYAVGKVGMSVLTKGLAMDFERQGLVGGRGVGEGAGMAISSLWPAVVSWYRCCPTRRSIWHDVYSPPVTTDLLSPFWGPCEGRACLHSLD